MNAPATEKEVAFRVAEAVRHIEIGLTSLTVLTLGVAFILYGVAIELSRVYPRWLGWLTVVGGGLWVVVGIFSAYKGFSPLTIAISQASGYVLLVWALALAVLMWRSQHSSPHRFTVALTSTPAPMPRRMSRST